MCIARIAAVRLLIHVNQQATHLYRITPESVNNAIHHGDAIEIEIRIELVGDFRVLTITDNGCGFDHSTGIENGEYVCTL